MVDADGRRWARQPQLDGVAMSLSGGPATSNPPPADGHSQHTGHCQKRSFRASPNRVRLVRCQAVVLQGLHF